AKLKLQAKGRISALTGRIEELQSGTAHSTTSPTATPPSPEPESAEHSPAQVTTPQCTIRSLQTKLEEKEEALVGRTRVVEMLQQELNNSEQNNQTAAKEQEVALLNRVAEMEEEKGSLLLKVVEFEEVRAENGNEYGSERGTYFAILPPPSILNRSPLHSQSPPPPILNRPPHPILNRPLFSIPPHSQSLLLLSQAVDSLTEERDGLLAQLELRDKELREVMWLKAELERGQESMALTEHALRLEMEEAIVSSRLLEERLHSSVTESRSKDVKVEALQKDLDALQHCLSEQEAEARAVREQGWESEQAVARLSQGLSENEAQAEELQRSLDNTEQQLALARHSLTQEATEAQRLRMALAQREEEVSEVTASLSEKMVELNEDKFSLGEEVKRLRERLCQLEASRGEGQEKVGLEEELEKLKKENEQIKRKFQASLVKRKELLKKVKELEKSVELQTSQSPALGKTDSDNNTGSSGQEREPELTAPLNTQIIELRRELSYREAEFGDVRVVLREQEAAMGQLRKLVGDLNQSLEERETTMSCLQTTISEKDLTIQQLLVEGVDSGGEGLETGYPGVEVLDPVTSLGSASGSELEAKLAGLELDREQLQRKLEEALSSRKETIKKAQEKARHHREQVRQQKEEYSLLAESLSQEQREKDSLRQDLLSLREQIRQTEESPSAPSDHQDLTAILRQKDKELEQLQLRLKEKEEESEERVAELEHTFGLEREELLGEIEALKVKCQEAEVYTEDLKLALETAKAHTSLSEELAAMSKEYEELKAILGQREEEMERLHLRLKEHEELIEDQRRRITSEQELAKALQDRMGEQLKEREELRAELQEARQREEEGTQEARSRQQIQRKLQAALISRKETLKENKSLKEEMAGAERDKEELTGKMADLERISSALRRESEETALKMSSLREQNGKLIEEVDKALDENYNLNSSCESLKLAVEGVLREKDSLEQEMVSLKEVQAGQRREWESKRAELQQEYETLLQAYENVGGETARLGRALDVAKQDRQELLSRLRAGEAGTRELEARLEEAAQEQERTREKMRKFAKSKQVKIQELEEEIAALQVKGQPGTPGTPPAAQTVPGLANEADGRWEDITGELATRNRELMAERESLEEEARMLRLHLADAEEKLKESLRRTGKDEETQERDVTSQDVTSQEEVPPAGHPEMKVKVEFEGKLGSNWTSPAGSTLAPKADGSGQRASELEKRVRELESQRQDTKNEIRALMAAKQAWEEERARMEGEIERQREEVRRVEQSLSERELDTGQWQEKVAAATRGKETAEAERDDLEERLMNQLAELNGSIANYQQELEVSGRKVCELEVMAQNQGRQVGELEEEIRQLRRSKAEGEDRMRKEFEQKVKSIQRGRDGSKTHNAELQELLREKQQEVKQLQKDCILYQESISHLQRSLKALQFVQDETQKALDTAKREAADRDEDSRRAREELAAFRVRLDDTQSEAGRVLADNVRLREEVKAGESKAQGQLARMEKELNSRLELEKEKCRKEVRNAQERAEGLEREKAHTEATVRELRDTLEEKREEGKRLQTSFNENLAKLAAFTRSMSSLQDDRDRIIDESRKWETKFNQDMVRKEEEMRSGQEEVARLKEAFRQSTIQGEELELKLSRSELAEREWESHLESVEASHRLVVGRLEEEVSERVARLEELQRLYADCESEVRRLSEEARGLQEEAATLRSRAETLMETQDRLEVRLRDSEAEAQGLRLTCEQLSSDLQTSKALTDQLQAEAGETEGKIVALLEAKEAAVGSAVSELQQQHAGELEQWEARLREAEGERDQAEQALRELEETQRHKDKMLTFSKSMASLQADRERVLAEHKELESRHRELGELRDRQAGEGVEETTQLREQLRELQARMDDTNSENAKLSAQLVRYREDLNQVITMKDCQHKQVLSSHVERVRALEGEKAEVREQLGEAESREQQLTQLLESVTGEKESLSGQLASLEGTVLELRQEVESLTGGGPLRVLQDQLEGKSAEAEELRGGLARAVTERDEARSKLQAAEARHMEELRRQERDTGIMRNETETAEERVAELARDLLEIEERLRQVMEEREGLRAQNQAFGKAMGSLQHSRDQLLAQLEEGSNKDAEARCRALEEDKAGLTAQLDGFARTVMALQGERDRLSDQLARGWRIQEARQGASPGTVSSPPTTTAAEAQSLRKALAALQDDRDRLLKELRQLRAERVRAGEESELRAQLRQLEAQLEEQRECRERADQDNADHHRQLQQFRFTLALKPPPRSLSNHPLARATRPPQITNSQRPILRWFVIRSITGRRGPYCKFSWWGAGGRGLLRAELSPRGPVWQWNVGIGPPPRDGL
uniref:Golgin B1 n=1 Tax=Callorhinchus milii TaxID=7868 RepID=A0A4W3GZT6_CALMI